MKKTLIVASLAIFGLASCKKDYTCTCKVNGIATGTATTINDTKKNAEETCNKNDATVVISGVTFTSDCSI